METLVRYGVLQRETSDMKKQLDYYVLNPLVEGTGQKETEEMKSKIWLVLGAILATAEETVPIFIHNPQSQKIEGVIVTAGNNLFTTLAQILGTPSTPSTTQGQ
jgi:hypothetical protein